MRWITIMYKGLVVTGLACDVGCAVWMFWAGYVLAGLLVTALALGMIGRLLDRTEWWNQ